MNKKGSALDILIWTVMAFFIVLFFATWLFGYGLLNDSLSKLGVVEINGNELNLSQASADTFGKVNESYQDLRLLSWVMIIGLIISIIMTNIFVTAHPGWAFSLHVVITIFTLIISAYISNAYEKLMASGALSSILQSFSASSYVLLNLPVFVAIVGLIGVVFLTLRITTNRL